MRKALATLSVLIACSSPALAKSHHHHRFHHSRHHYSHHSLSHHYAQRGARLSTSISGDSHRPSAWCGWFMRGLMHVTDTAYNLARNWAHYGHATSPHVGAIVVWSHHVGKIVGGSPGHWAVLSGNDGHAVRTRVRSIAGAIAFRE